MTTPLPTRCPAVPVLLLLCSAASHGATTPAAAPCDPRDTVTTLKAQGPSSNIISAMVASMRPLPGELCTSFKAVIGLLGNNPLGGGRKLEKDKAYNPSTAAAEYAATQAQADYAKELAGLQAGETDPLRRKLIEAVLLHDLGKFEARDLVLKQLTP